MTNNPFFTIGHSTLSIEEFIDHLRMHEITQLIDVRKIPKSRHNPQYDHVALSQSLQEHQIGYQHIAELGGLRKKTKDTPIGVNSFWKNVSFHHYADYALSAEFHNGLQQLIAIGREKRTVIMCAEAVWWRCHRRIISDYLIAHGETVYHIMSKGKLELAKLTSGAVKEKDGTLIYQSSGLVEGDA